MHKVIVGGGDADSKDNGGRPGENETVSYTVESDHCDFVTQVNMICLWSSAYSLSLVCSLSSAAVVLAIESPTPTPSPVPSGPSPNAAAVSASESNGTNANRSGQANVKQYISEFIPNSLRSSED